MQANRPGLTQRLCSGKRGEGKQEHGQRRKMGAKRSKRGRILQCENRKKNVNFILNARKPHKITGKPKRKEFYASAKTGQPIYRRDPQPAQAAAEVLQRQETN